MKGLLPRNGGVYRKAAEPGGNIPRKYSQEGVCAEKSLWLISLRKSHTNEDFLIFAAIKMIVVNKTSRKGMVKCVNTSGYYALSVATKQGSRYVMIRCLQTSHYFVQSVNRKQ
ncbi:MAG: hypothetical protein K0S01_1520 [Herbinix sp.]|nr:hypothetical protein [Herbinix sp.]